LKSIRQKSVKQQGGQPAAHPAAESQQIENFRSAKIERSATERFFAPPPPAGFPKVTAVAVQKSASLYFCTPD